MKTLPLAHIELSKKNLIYNIKQLKSLVKKGTNIVAVIKANAYGHGQNEVAKILESYVDYFAVNSISELESLRKVSKKKTFVLGYVQEDDLPKMIKLSCVLSVFSKEQMLKISAIAEKFNKVMEVNIMIDAHLGREGILKNELPEFIEILKKCKYLKVIGVYAHFANIEDTANFTHAKKQIKEYEQAITLIKESGFKNLETHISATSGILVYEKNLGIHPVVRFGIGLYGMWPSEYLKSVYLPSGGHGTNSKFNLKPVLAWKSKIAQIKILPKGATIGYGLTYKTKKEMKVAVIPQGYADGLDRRLSNKGEVLIGGTRCKILGRVMMNMCVVDVSHLPKVKAEDEVVFIGKQIREQITAEEMGIKIGTINYEITTRLSTFLPRIIT